MIRFDNVGLRYGLGAEILSDVTFHLEPGSFHFLTGQSGAGKTSLLSLMYLSRRPTRGTISLFGYDLSRLGRKELPELRRRVGVVFQDFRLLNHLSAFENVALPLKIAGIDYDHYKDDVMELLTWVGLGDRTEARPSTLSGGEQQRIAIARAVVGKPDLLLADEPTGNVDDAIGARIMRLFAELNKMGASIVIATHDLTHVRRLPAPRLHLVAGRMSVLPPLEQADRPARASAAGQTGEDQ